MKKIIALALATVMSLSFCMYASAADTEYACGEVEIIFAEDSAFSEEIQQIIADQMRNGDDGASTYDLFCSLFGHNETTEEVNRSYHKVNTYDPRCLLEKWNVTACTRCGDITGQTLVFEMYVSCCPED